MPVTTREVALVVRSGGAGMAQAVAVALALPLGGCDVFLVLEGAARELANRPETQGTLGPDGMQEQMEALLAEDGVEVVVRWDAGEGPALVSRLPPQVRILEADEIEARCRQAHHWLVM
jgi:hypothetical protein